MNHHQPQNHVVRLSRQDAYQIKGFAKMKLFVVNSGMESICRFLNYKVKVHPLFQNLTQQLGTRK